MNTAVQNRAHGILVITSNHKKRWRDFITSVPLTKVAYSFVHNQDGTITETGSLDDLDLLVGTLAGLLLRMKEVESFFINHHKLTVKVRQSRSWLKISAQVIDAICCIKGWSPDTVVIVQVKRTDINEDSKLAHYIAAA